MRGDARVIEPAVHGGDVWGIARARGRPVSDFIDFSANINPLGPPPNVRALLEDYARDDTLTRYPEPGLPELRAALAAARGVEPQHILIAAGSSALFDVILRDRAPRRLGLCVPAFAEYARAAAANGIEVRTFALDPNADFPFDPARFCAWARDETLDAVMVTNPHNPLGFALAAPIVHELRRQLRTTTLIVDEAFADYDESVSVARDAAADADLIVVRSLTKFYAMPDLRVGYAVMTAARARTMARFIPAWPVCGIAAAAAAAAIRDERYAARTRAANAQNRAELSRALTSRGLRVLPSSANFLTFATEDARALHARLLENHGIIVRECSSFAGLVPDRHVRVAVRERADNARLLAALDAELSARPADAFTPAPATATAQPVSAVDAQRPR